MISEHDLHKIHPELNASQASDSHVQSGIPIPKATRIRTFSPSDWEEFVEEWATSLNTSYVKVRRFAGSGDLGVDIAGFCSDQKFKGDWDNYQCKQYDHPLRPSDIWIEIGKIIYYSYKNEYTVPLHYYFVCSQGVGTKLEKLLNKPNELKSKAAENWEQHCRKGITTTEDVELFGDILHFFNGFDFNIFSSKSHLDLIDAHSQTGYHSVRFGGGLPLRPDSRSPPDSPTEIESIYIRQLLDAYGSHLGEYLINITSLDNHDSFKSDYLRQRERFYHAESLRNFARDTVPEGTFDQLQEEIFYGVVDIAEATHSDGLKRMREAVAHASTIPVAANPLASATKTQDKQGICHQLANVDRLKWVPNND